MTLSLKKNCQHNLVFSALFIYIFVVKSISSLVCDVLTLLKTFRKLQFSKLSTYMLSLHYSCDLEKRLPGQRLVCIGSMLYPVLAKNLNKMALGTPSSRSNLQVIEELRDTEARRAPAQIARERSLESTSCKTHVMPYFVLIFLQNKTKHFSNKRSIILKNEHNLSIFWSKNEHCLETKMPL